MEKRTRELVYMPAMPALNEPKACYFCSRCLWGVSVEYTTGQTYQQVAQADFDAHNCEDYPIREDVDQAEKK